MRTQSADLGYTRDRMRGDDTESVDGSAWHNPYTACSERSALTLVGGPESVVHRIRDTSVIRATEPRVSVQLDLD